MEDRSQSPTSETMEDAASAETVETDELVDSVARLADVIDELDSRIAELEKSMRSQPAFLHRSLRKRANAVAVADADAAATKKRAAPLPGDGVGAQAGWRAWTPDRDDAWWFMWCASLGFLVVGTALETLVVLTRAALGRDARVSTATRFFVSGVQRVVFVLFCVTTVQEWIPAAARATQSVVVARYAAPVVFCMVMLAAFEWRAVLACGAFSWATATIATPFDSALPLVTLVAPIVCACIPALQQPRNGVFWRSGAVVVSAAWLGFALGRAGAGDQVQKWIHQLPEYLVPIFSHSSPS